MNSLADSLHDYKKLCLLCIIALGRQVDIGSDSLEVFICLTAKTSLGLPASHFLLVGKLCNLTGVIMCNQTQLL